MDICTDCRRDLSVTAVMENGDMLCPNCYEKRINKQKAIVTINQYELRDLLEDEIDFTESFFNEDSATMQVVLEWGDVFKVILEHCHHQVYKIIFSECEMVEGSTISVDEILDIVL